MNKKALKLLSRFSFSPNHHGYCGLDSAGRAFTNCIADGNCTGVEPEIAHFKGLYPYLQTIAEVTGLHYLDYDVIESYWLGNDLLQQFKPKHYQVLIKHLKAQNLPDFFIDQVAANKPKAFIPLHLFNVIHIGVGQITGSVPTNFENINHCAIRWGRVTKVDKNNHQVSVDLNSLVLKNKVYDLRSTIHDLDYNPTFFPKLKVGQTLSVHWKSPAKLLTKKETQNLEFWTNKLISQL